VQHAAAGHGQDRLALARGEALEGIAPGRERHDREVRGRTGDQHAGAGAEGGSADALYNQGVVAWNAGRTDEARGHFEAALKADPNHAPAHFQLGMALVNGGSLPQAKSEFETYLKLAPDGQFAAQAKAMIGARVGDTVKWQRPAGATEVEIVAIRYDAGHSARRA